MRSCVLPHSLSATAAARRLVTDKLAAQLISSPLSPLKAPLRGRPVSARVSAPESAGAMDVDESKVSPLDGKTPEGSDFANYFCTYGYLYHQKDMLEDHKRTGAYYQAIVGNRAQFKDKVVLDVGAGSGILSVFAAQAGAKKVYAIEATTMAKFAKKVIEANKYGEVIEVVQGMIETIELPEKVDIIVSEWMGYFLLRESMLDSVLVARDRFLKPDGALYPSHANILMAPIRTPMAGRRVGELHSSMEGWAQFIAETRQYYNVDLDVLSNDFHLEQKDYFLSTASWTDVHPSQMMGPARQFAEFDLKTCTIEDIKVVKGEFTLDLSGGPIEGFCGFFTVDFNGSKEHPASNPVHFSTRPDPTGATHWGQMTFVLNPSIQAGSDDQLKCGIEVTRRKDNHRLLKVDLGVEMPGNSMYAQNFVPRQLKYNID